MSDSFSINWSDHYDRFKDELTNNADVLIAVTHWYLIKRGYVCLSIGTNESLGENEIRTRMLPPNWYGDHKEYNLRYLRDNHVYILNGTCLGDDKLQLTLKRSTSCKTASEELAFDLVRGEFNQNVGERIMELIPSIGDVKGKLDKMLDDLDQEGYKFPPQHSSASSHSETQASDALPSPYSMVSSNSEDEAQANEEVNRKLDSKVRELYSKLPEISKLPLAKKRKLLEYIKEVTEEPTQRYNKKLKQSLRLQAFFNRALQIEKK